MKEQGTAKIVTLGRLDDVVESTAARPAMLAPVELPRARRPGWPTLAAIALATGIAAIGLGAWSVVAESRSEETGAVSPTADWSLAVLADSSAVRYPLRGSVGRIALVVTDRGDAVIALDGLGPAPTGDAYRVWIVRPGSATPVPDATFDGSERVVPIERRIVPDTRVAVTLEPSGDATRPSRPLRLSAVVQ